MVAFGSFIVCIYITVLYIYDANISRKFHTIRKFGPELIHTIMEVDVFERIKRIVETRKIPMVKLIKAVGLSEQGYYKMARTKSMKMSTLSNILSFLRINESDFFSSDFAEMIHQPSDKLEVNDLKTTYSHSKDTRTALIEKDLIMMETLIKSIRETLNH